MTAGNNTNPPGSRPDEDDDDRTRIAPRPAAGAAPAPEEDDRTILNLAPAQGSLPPRPEGGIAQPEGGASHRPFSQAAAAPVAPSAPPPPAASTMTSSISSDQIQGHTAGAAMRALEPGMVINNMYRVEERIDHGGMGRVFRGTEIGTGESVAIKVILPEMAEDPRVAQMFRREARTLRQLHHDAIVRYFAYVPPDAHFNLHALVMGFIEGTKLSDKVKEDGPLTTEQVCQLFLRLAAGLERAHKIGIVHRDLSPDNVMLPDGDISKALLIDFGISRSSKVREGTIGNEFAGKLKYVSPEQLGAYGGEAEGPSDVYSFALLMIVTLTGKALAMGSSIVEAVQKRQTVPDLSAVPAAFQTLLYQMLQPDPAQRMKSMEEVIAGLRAISGGETLTRAPLTTAPTSAFVHGLQAAPNANATGLGFVSTPPTSARTSAPPIESGGGFGKVLGLLAVLAMIGGGAWYGMGMPGLPTERAEAEEADTGMTRIAGSRETFLAENIQDPCGFATRRAKGPNAGMIEGFAAQPAALDGIAEAYSAAFGTRPSLVSNRISPEQCPALEIARTFQGTAGGAVELALDAQTVSRSSGIVGALHGSSGRENWLALITPTGRVFSLMSKLGQPIGEQRSFSFRLPSAEPGSYILVATASDSALVRAGAMSEGMQAANLLPLIATELAKDGQGAVTIALMELTR